MLCIIQFENLRFVSLLLPYFNINKTCLDFGIFYVKLLTELVNLKIIKFQVGELLLSSVEMCKSTLGNDDDKGLIDLVFSSLGLGIAKTLNDLFKLASLSLYSLQTSDDCLKTNKKVSSIYLVLHSQVFFVPFRILLLYYGISYLEACY